jgi:hypothetical protein
MGRLTPDEIAAWVTESCVAQGIPVQICDPHVIQRVAVLMGRTVEGSRARLRSTRPAPDLHLPSNPPHGLNAGGVKTARTGGSGGDDRMIEDGRHDCLLPRQVERGPLAS